MGTPEDLPWDPSIGAHVSWATQDISNTAAEWWWRMQNSFLPGSTTSKTSQRNRTKHCVVGSIYAPGGISHALCTAFSWHRQWEALVRSPDPKVCPCLAKDTAVHLFPTPASCHSHPEGSLFTVVGLLCSPVSAWVGFSLQKNTVDLWGFVATSTLKSHGLNCKRSPWLFAYGAMSRAEFYGCNVEILLRSLDVSLWSRSGCDVLPGEPVQPLPTSSGQHRPEYSLVSAPPSGWDHWAGNLWFCGRLNAGPTGLATELFYERTQHAQTWLRTLWLWVVWAGLITLVSWLRRFAGNSCVRAAHSSALHAAWAVRMLTPLSHAPLRSLVFALLHSWCTWGQGSHVSFH